MEDKSVVTQVVEPTKRREHLSGNKDPQGKNGTLTKSRAPYSSDQMTSRAPIPGFEASLNKTIEQSRDYLLSLQHEEGYWVGHLGNVDATLASDYIMLMYFLDEVDSKRQEKAIRFILSQQNSEGGWSLYPGGASEVSASVKAYFALKLTGHSPDEPELAAAREVIHRLGGLDCVNSFTKIYLAMFDQFKWDEVPTVPAELMLIPETFYLNLNEMSSWSRAILVPLTIISALKPHHPLPKSARIDELFVLPRRKGLLLEANDVHWKWEHFFTLLDRLAKVHERIPYKPWRNAALKRAEEWMLKRCIKGGLGAVYPSMLNTIVALKTLGYSNDHPKVRLARKEFNDLMVETEDMITFQPCFSPVWDTAISAIALYDSGLPETHPALERSRRWLLDKECKIKGDWSIRDPHTPAGGWYFEFDNEFYPDTDDTVMTLLALHRLKADKIEGGKEAMDRGLEWIKAIQSDDGGWGAFDRNNNKEVFTKVPFSDHNALLDPSTSDITSRMFELFGMLEIPKTEPFVARAIEFLKREQEPEGCWYGRWGVNYIYGTWQVLRGMADIGEDMNQPYIRKAAHWLASCQNPDGGWGESCDSYEDPSLKGKGESTPSQTAWALIGLIAARTDGENQAAITGGIKYLCETQRADGGWDEAHYTGTGFPKVFYLEYTMYRHYFPLIALSYYRRKENAEIRS